MHDSALDILFNLSVAVLLIGVVVLLAYTIGPLVFMLLVAAGRARSMDDWLAVLLVLAGIVWLGGDYLIFFLSSAANTAANPSLTAYVHFWPHVTFAFVFVLRIIVLGYPHLGRGESALWRLRSGPVPVWLFVVMGVVDAGDYLLRSSNVGLFDFVPVPWTGFWVHCAVLAVVTWALAALAFWLSTRERPRDP